MYRSSSTCWTRKLGMIQLFFQKVTSIALSWTSPYVCTFTATMAICHDFGDMIFLHIFVFSYVVTVLLCNHPQGIKSVRLVMGWWKVSMRHTFIFSSLLFKLWLPDANFYRFAHPYQKMLLLTEIKIVRCFKIALNVFLKTLLMSELRTCRNRKMRSLL